MTLAQTYFKLKKSRLPEITWKMHEPILSYDDLEITSDEYCEKNSMKRVPTAKIINKRREGNAIPLMLFTVDLHDNGKGKQVTGCATLNQGCDSQSKYNRECLSLISNMDFQFWALWAAQDSKGKNLGL